MGWGDPVIASHIQLVWGEGGDCRCRTTAHRPPVGVRRSRARRQCRRRAVAAAGRGGDAASAYCRALPPTGGVSAARAPCRLDGGEDAVQDDVARHPLRPLLRRVRRGGRLCDFQPGSIAGSRRAAGGQLDSRAHLSAIDSTEY